MRQKTSRCGSTNGSGATDRIRTRDATHGPLRQTNTGAAGGESRMRGCVRHRSVWSNPARRRRLRGHCLKAEAAAGCGADRHRRSELTGIHDTTRGPASWAYGRSRLTRVRLSGPGNRPRSQPCLIWTFSRVSSFTDVFGRYKAFTRFVLRLRLTRRACRPVRASPSGRVARPGPSGPVRTGPGLPARDPDRPAPGRSISNRAGRTARRRAPSAADPGPPPVRTSSGPEPTTLPWSAAAQAPRTPWGTTKECYLVYGR